MILRKILKCPNFFSDEDLIKIREYSKTAEFTIPGAAFMGHSTEFFPEDLRDLIINTLLSKTDFLLHPPRGDYSVFQLRLALRGDKCAYSNSMHTDGSDAFWDRNLLAIIIPLSDPPENEPDHKLIFYKNKLFGNYSYRQLPPDEMYKLEWENYLEIPYNKNEAVIFHPCMFHAPTPGHGYGDSAENGRLSIHCFLRIGFNEEMHINGYNLEVKEI